MKYSRRKKKVRGRERYSEENIYDDMNRTTRERARERNKKEAKGGDRKSRMEIG